MLSVLNEVSKYWLEGTVRSLEGIRRGMSDKYPVDEDPPPDQPVQCGL